MKAVTYSRWRTHKTYFNTVNADAPLRVQESLLASGWALSSDTNQADWATLTQADFTTGGAIPSSAWTLTASRWNTYYLDDALHSTLPIYLALGWVWNGATYSQMYPWMYVGTITDGAGKIVNSSCYGYAEAYNASGSTVWEPLPIASTGGNGYAGLALINQGITSLVAARNANLSFLVSRTTDGNGSPTGEGFFVYTNQGLFNKNCYFHDGNINNGFLIADVASSMRRSVFNFGNFSTSRVTKLQTYRIQAITAAKTFVDENAVVCTSDMIWPSTFKATPLSIERTFMPMGGVPGTSARHHVVDSGGTSLAFRWE